MSSFVNGMDQQNNNKQNWDENIFNKTVLNILKTDVSA